MHLWLLWSHVSQPVPFRVRPAPNKGPNPPLLYELAITPPNAAKRARPIAYMSMYGVRLPFAATNILYK